MRAGLGQDGRHLVTASGGQLDGDLVRLVGQVAVGILDAQVNQVARLDLRAKFIVEGFLTGLHASPFQGFSVEFSEHRKYVPGDDLKDLDWNVFAKTDKYYLKKYQAETNVTGYLVMDLSASMA